MGMVPLLPCYYLNTMNETNRFEKLKKFAKPIFKFVMKFEERLVKIRVAKGTHRTTVRFFRNQNKIVLTQYCMYMYIACMIYQD